MKTANSSGENRFNSVSELNGFAIFLGEGILEILLGLLSAVVIDKPQFCS
ncbi:MAG: hypothetical protein ACI8ZX_000686 [Planctomycetota bacterium]|jgi:hypothetical protein